jgi:hypothetical protein
LIFFVPKTEGVLMKKGFALSPALIGLPANFIARARIVLMALLLACLAALALILSAPELRAEVSDAAGDSEVTEIASEIVGADMAEAEAEITFESDLLEGLKGYLEDFWRRGGVILLVGAFFGFLIAWLCFGARLRKVARGRLKGAGSPSFVGLGIKDGKAPALGEVSVPAGIFPSEWLDKIDNGALEEWFREARSLAAKEYFEALGTPGGTQGEANGGFKVPDAEALKAAEKRLSLSLRKSLSDGKLFRALGGGSEGASGAGSEGASGGVKLSETDASIVASHLHGLLPDLTLPPFAPASFKPRTSAAALFAAIGAVLGDLLGGALLSFMGQPLETGILLGAALGAALGVALALWLSENDKIRKRLILIVGGVAAVDGALTLAKGVALPSFLGGKSSFIKRFFLYLALTLALFLVKPKADFDRGSLSKSLEARLDSYLRAVIPLAAVLIYRIKEKRGPSESYKDSSLIGEIAPLILRLGEDPRYKDDAALSEAARRLSNAGFAMEVSPGSEPQRSLVWERSLADRYDTFGLVKEGETVLVEKEPLVKNGEVFTKGLVIRE